MAATQDYTERIEQGKKSDKNVALQKTKNFAPKITEFLSSFQEETIVLSDKWKKLLFLTLCLLAQEWEKVLGS